MIDLYKMHANPESLRWHKYNRLLPWNILEDIRGGVEPTPMQKQVLYQSPRWAYELATGRDQRIKEAEPYILQSPRWAFWYAIEVIHGPWPEAEPAILKYALKNGDGYMIAMYAGACLRDRWSEGEEVLRQLGNTVHLQRYADIFRLDTVTDDDGDLKFVEQRGRQ